MVFVSSPRKTDLNWTMPGIGKEQGRVAFRDKGRTLYDFVPFAPEIIKV